MCTPLQLPCRHLIGTLNRFSRDQKHLVLLETRGYVSTGSETRGYVSTGSEIRSYINTGSEIRSYINTGTRQAESVQLYALRKTQQLLEV